YGGSAGDPHREQQADRPVPRVDDPLEDVSFGQHLANVTRRGTSAVDRPTGVTEDARLITATAGGQLGRERFFDPEPLPEEVDDLARVAHLDTVPYATREERRKATLKLVRALSMVFGNRVKADRARYEQALEGIGALETLRFNDPDLRHFTHFRMDLWTTLAA